MSRIAPQHTTLTILHDLLTEASCPRDREGIRKHIEAYRQSDERIRKFLKHYDISSVVKVAKGIVEARTIGTMTTAGDLPASSNQVVPEQRLIKKSQIETTSKIVDAPIATQLYQVQHLILTDLQTVLEHVCYRFTKDRMPAVLLEQGWDCAEALELNIWSGVMRRHNASFKLQLAGNEDVSTDELLLSLARLRHSAVHRERQHIDTIEKLLTVAESMALAFGDSSHQHTVTRLQQILKSVVAEQKTYELSKAALAHSIDQQRDEIMAQNERKREELKHQHKLTLKELIDGQSRGQQVLSDKLLRKVQANPAKCGVATNLWRTINQSWSFCWYS